MARLLHRRLTFLLMLGVMACHVRSFSPTTVFRRIRSRSWQYPAITTTDLRSQLIPSSFLLFSTTSNDESDTEKKKIIFLGTPEVAASSLRSIHEASQLPDSPFTLSSVVTQPPRRRRRKGKLEASPVGKVAEELALAVHCPEKASDSAFLETLEQEHPALCITAAYGQYLPKRFLACPRYGTVNIHPSLLPRWRGASPVQRSLEAGDNPVGVSILYTVSKMDAGPVIAQQEMSVAEEDTATNVLPALFELGTEMLLEKLPDILSGKITMETAQEQDESAVVQAAMIDSSEAELKVWEESATTCVNRLRGFSMWPQTYMWFRVGDRPEPLKVKILKARVVPGETAGPSKEVKLGPDKKSGLYVVCVDGSIMELLQVQPATRKAFPARDFQNGYPGETIRWIKTPAETK